MSDSGKSWVCLVCGYVHHGDEPPECCPVCGAPASDFELQEAAPAPAAAPVVTKWRCLVCGYEHDGDGPPEACPVCGVPAEEFEACAPESPVASRRDDKRSIVILGGGIAGVSAAEGARQASSSAEIVLVSAEEHLPYYRLNLTRRLAGEIGDEALPIHPESWYEEKQIQLLRGQKASELRPESKQVVLKDGRELSYDSLILACGAHPFVPPVPGAEKKGVFTIRTLEDVQALEGMLSPGAPCVCIGGGILGLETAGALAKRGIAVTLLENYGYLLPRQLNREASALLSEEVKGLGIQICSQAAAAAIIGEDAVEGVVLKDGTELPAAAVCITTGIRSNSHLARRAGLAVGQGVVVDNHLQTSVPDIYAAGDCAEYGGCVYGLWEPAQYQGNIAGMNAAGVPTEFGGIARMTTLKVLGMKMFSLGTINPKDGSYTEISTTEDDTYRCYLFRDNRLAGAILVGDTSLASTAARLLREKTDCSAAGLPATVEGFEAFLRDKSAR
jgi:nitrite reductase (NADH) large subunit